ncbi:MAG: hypothetical protein K2N74_02340, partial [Clostridiales bacterium]|nr:hypothetical protein [Clostridiales bacterium]
MIFDLCIDSFFIITNTLDFVNRIRGFSQFPFPHYIAKLKNERKKRTPAGVPYKFDDLRVMLDAVLHISRVDRARCAVHFRDRNT